MPRSKTEFDSHVTKCTLAREEFLANYCVHWPATYRAMMPLTDQGSELLAWKDQIEQKMADDFAEIAENRSDPFAPEPRRPARLIDWTGVNAERTLALGMDGFYIGEVNGVRMYAKFGEGIDPADGQRKAFADFAQVQQIKSVVAHRATTDAESKPQK